MMCRLVIVANSYSAAGGKLIRKSMITVSEEDSKE
jgi:hypothetical protein